MGDVAIVVRVMPEDAETDLDAIEAAIEEAIPVEDIGREEVAFGLQAIKVSTIVADDAGGTDMVEDALSGIDGVQSVEIEDMNRL